MSYSASSSNPANYHRFWTRTSYGPTQTHRQQLAIAAEQFEAFLPQLRDFVDGALPDLQQILEDAGVPWTPGRGVPTWQR